MSEHDDLLADLLALVASGRADPLVDVAMADVPAPVRAELSGVREAFASLALGEPSRDPSPELRARILRSFAHRARSPRRAILVLDMLNDHLTPGRPLEVPRARAIVPAIVARLEAARREGEPIVYVNDEHDPDDADLDAWGAHNVSGSEGAQVWPAIAPKAGDRVVRKTTYSAFSHSDLAAVLTCLRVDTLVMTGCLTEVGVLATATDALQRGYAVEVPPDAQAGATEANEQVALGILRVLPPYGPARKALLAQIEAEAPAA